MNQMCMKTKGERYPNREFPGNSQLLPLSPFISARKPESEHLNGQICRDIA